MVNGKLWGGRFSKQSAAWIDEFGASIGFDQEMAHEDLEGSIAHAQMLEKTGIISADDATKIISGLQEIQEDLQNNKLEFKASLEDIHMNIETILTSKIGPVAGKLHTARSRNDQVATDLHLYLKNRIPEVISAIQSLQVILVKKAADNIETIIPGYTHLQHAQPISYAHYLLAYYEMLKRDIDRFLFNVKHTDINPLGAAALAGTTFPIDRFYTTNILGFNDTYNNSLDAVSDRDFVLEFLSDASILMVHLSRFCEEIILWCSYEFGYLELDDSYSTGSSIMPQKKNPDMAELIRGKSGRVFGHLQSLLTTMKGLPLAYNKDMQEDKEGVFDTVKTIIPSIKVFSGMVETLKINKTKMLHATQQDYSNATEFADYLANKGIPFRQAHGIVGQLVFEGIQTGKTLQEIPLSKLKQISPLIDEDIFNKLTSKEAVARRNSYGGTGFEQVKFQVDLAKKELNL